MPIISIMSIMCKMSKMSKMSLITKKNIQITKKSKITNLTTYQSCPKLRISEWKVQIFIDIAFSTFQSELNHTMNLCSIHSGC